MVSRKCLLIPILLACGTGTGLAASPTLAGSVMVAPQTDFVTLLLATPGVPNESLGYSVDISGDSIIAGAPDARDTAVDRGPGAAYVFVRGPGGTWTQQQRLLATGGVNRDFFGAAVSIDGDLAVVGASLAPAATNQGAVYVYTRTAGVWTQVQRIDPPVAAVNEFFGNALSLEGDALLIGAVGRRTPQNLGNAYIYRRTGGVFALEAELLPTGEPTLAGYGTAVSLSGTTAVVGSFADSSAGFSNAGAAFVFVKTGATAWPQQQKLLAPDAAADDFFGSAVAIVGDRLVVGAALDDKLSGGNAGSAHVFQRTAGTWTHRIKLVSSSAVANEDFGQAAVMVGTDVHVGAFCQSVVAPPCSAPGAFYSFSDLGQGYVAEPRTVPAGGQPGELFGFAISASPGFIVTGAYRRDSADGTDTGGVYVHLPVDQRFRNGFEDPPTP